MLFISYSSEDEIYAYAICLHLEFLGFQCWIAPRDLPNNRPYTEGVLEAIAASNAMIVVQSGYSMRSQHVAQEVTLAFDRRKPLLVHKIDTCALSGGLAYHLATADCVEATTEKPFTALTKLGKRASLMVRPPTRSPMPTHTPVVVRLCALMGSTVASLLAFLYSGLRNDRAD